MNKQDKQRSACLLVGDIGGTNARFALAGERDVGFHSRQSFSCEDFEQPLQAIRQYLADVDAPVPDAVCLAAAGPIVNTSVRFTNNHWNISADELSADLGNAPVKLVNDFEAIACSLPFLGDSDSVPISLPATAPSLEDDFTCAVIGPGTGLGCAGLMQRGGQLIPIVGEGGHTGFAPESRIQMDVLGALREKFDRVSDERLVSGPGIENLYWALCKVHGESPATLTAAQVFERAQAETGGRADEAVQLFFELLGQVAGNLALTIKATDGVFIAGGIAQRYPALIENSRFRFGFENKGRYRSLMEMIPTRLVTHPDPGLLGASYRARELLRKD